MIKFKEIFTDFTTPYLKMATENELADYQLKYDHSLRVLKNCQGIRESLNLTGEPARTAEIAALFHDTGRFPQYKNYKTFRDADSCNHATMGVKYILRKKLLHDLPKPQLRIILGSIALHNRSKVPANIPPQLKLTTEIVRDSDKLDIMDVLLSHMSNDGIHRSVPLMGLEEKTDEFTDSIISSVEAGEQAVYMEMNCLNDFRLLLLSWAYDLNFKWSKKQMIERKAVDIIFSNLPKCKRITDLYQPIMKQLNS